MQAKSTPTIMAMVALQLDTHLALRFLFQAVSSHMVRAPPRTAKMDLLLISTGYILLKVRLQ